MINIATTRMNRRSFLKAGAAVTGGLVVSLTLPFGTRPADAGTATADAARFSPNAFIRIDHQGIATLVMPMVEMGQGVYQGQAMLIAEELEIGLDQVRLEHAPADPAYINPLIGGQITGGSTTIRAMWLPLRQAGAVARTLLVQAAAARWGVDAAGCTARDGRVHDAAGGRSFGYGALVDDAARLPLPDAAAVALKDPADFRLIGRPLHRLDTADKVNGRAQFGIDARLPGMKIAAIAIAPVFGGRPAGLDEAAAKAVRGVHQVVTTDEAVAVIAEHWWAAHKGLEAAAIRWDGGEHGSVGMADLRADLDAASRRPGAVARDDGGVRVHRLVVAVDCGRAVNPDQIRAQMEGGAIFGLTAALHGEITITDGRVVQGNFDTCLPMRIDEVPVVETHLIDSSEAPGGIGETATAAVSPAVTNAIFAATGKRLRRLPIDPAALKRA